ncbi:hypothetical protein BOX15_Mlig008054g1 [Macrostomum lignano]|uniref:Major facilitator superfamily (MFS) profile domain-containing protein n=1 Tax=Macrostomum lignano TaxID=282301 RepID=A0A267ENV7_9PLAT|nr:hypothetical protein BOX15_Mlig008054g1 [Macrostomum lignano]
MYSIGNQHSGLSVWSASTRTTVALCSLANFINSADRVIMPITIIPMAQEFGWTLHDQGTILSAFPVGYIASTLVAGSAARRYGGKLVLTLAVALWSVSTLLTPSCASSSFSALVACRLALGLGEGLGLPAIFHLLALRVPAEQRSTAFGYLVALGSAGQTLSTLICPHLDWSSPFYLFGFGGIVWVLVWLVAFRSNKTHSTPGLSGADDEEAGMGSTGDPLASAGVRWFEYISHWPLWAIYIAHFSMNWSNYIIMNWLPTYLARTLGADKNQIMFTAAPYVLNSVVGIATGYFADALIRKRWSILSVRRLMTFIGLMGPGLLILAFSGTNSLLTAVLLITLSMGLSACNSSGHLANHADVAPGHAGVTFAVSNVLATIPGVLCGPLTAELVTKSGGRWFPVYILAGLMNLVGAVIYASQSSASQIF